MRFVILLLPSLLFAAEPDCAKPSKKNLIPCYVTSVRAVVKKYRTELQTQVRQQQTLYDTVASLAFTGRKDARDGELEFQRNLRSESLAAAFAEGRRPTSTWREALLEYANLDLASARADLEAHIAGEASLLAGLDSLQIDLARLDAFDKILASLQSPPTLTDEIAELGNFAQQTKTDFDKLVCAGLKAQLAAEASANTPTAKALIKARAEKKCKD